MQAAATADELRLPRKQRRRGPRRGVQDRGAKWVGATVLWSALLAGLAALAPAAQHTGGQNVSTSPTSAPPDYL